MAGNLGMSAHRHLIPAYQVTVDGVDVTAALHPRLMSLRITDNRGFEADTIDITLDDSDGQLAMPRRGARLRVGIGWQGQPLVDKGAFTIDELEHSGTPDTLAIRGKSADLRASLNKIRQASYHKTTIGAIVDQVAQRHQLIPAAAERFKGLLIDHADQQDESDPAFLTRLAQECGAACTIKAGRLLFITPGGGVSASGQPLPAVTLTRQDGDAHRFAVADRDAYTGVSANWHDPSTATTEGSTIKRKRKRKKKPEETLPSDVTIDKEGRELLIGDSENVKVLRHVYANKTNALRAARAEWERLQRGVAEFEITLAVGRPELYPEQPARVSGYKPEIDAAAWTLTQVTHDISPSGYTNGLRLEVAIKELPDVDE